jgi:hypothetical protein
MAERDERKPGIKGEDRVSAADVVIYVGEGLCVSNQYTDEDPDRADLAVAATGVRFSAKVTVAQTAGPGTWHVGWIQTAYPCSQSVTYQNPSGPGQGKMVATQKRPMADGPDTDDGSGSGDGDETEDAKHWAWYDEPKECTVGQSVKVKLHDEPNVPFHSQYKGSAAPWIAGWRAVAVAGQAPLLLACRRGARRRDRLPLSRGLDRRLRRDTG